MVSMCITKYLYYTPCTLNSAGPVFAQNNYNKMTREVGAYKAVQSQGIQLIINFEMLIINFKMLFTYFGLKSVYLGNFD